MLLVFLILALGSSDGKTTPEQKQKLDANRTQTAKDRENYTPPPPVRNSSWDGSVYQVKNFLEKSLKDPDSVQYIEWSEVIELYDGGYAVRCKYRAKNSFGGYVINEQIFYMNSEGDVINYHDGNSVQRKTKPNKNDRPAKQTRQWTDENGVIHLSTE